MRCDATFARVKPKTPTLIFAAIFLGVLWYTWPDPPWLMLQIVGVSVMILAPFLFYPFSKTLFLAFDLAFRPASHDELV